MEPTTKVKLLIDVDAEGVHIPAGTVVLVQRFYPMSNEPGNEYLANYDLLTSWPDGVKFWVNADEVEPV